jgi:hypothetical protein
MTRSPKTNDPINSINVTAASQSAIEGETIEERETRRRGERGESKTRDTNVREGKGWRKPGP